MVATTYIRIICLVFSVVIISGCSGTTVVLVPDPGGKVGHVTVTTDGGTAELSKSGESTKATEIEHAPQIPEVLSDEKIQDMFGVALANEPTPPERHQVDFMFDSAELLPHSKLLLTDIYQAIKARKICDASVIGHTDLAGGDEHNQRLSGQRANTVYRQLIAMGIAQECMDVRHYGEKDPIVPTADGVAEFRNRRVEVEIR